MPITPLPYAVATQEDYRIELIDNSLKTRFNLDMAHGVCYPIACYGYGRAGALALHILSEPAQAIRDEGGDWFIRVYRKAVYIRTFKVLKDEYGYKQNLSTDDDYLALTLRPAEEQLTPIFGQGSGIGVSFSSPSLPLDDGMKWLVDHACGPNAYLSPDGASRVMAGLTIAADLSAHATTAVISSMNKEPLLEWLKLFGASNEIDFSLDLVETAGDDNEWVFSTYYPRRGLDKTEGNGARDPVIINDASLNIISGSRFREYAYYNVVVSQDFLFEVADAADVAASGRKELLATTNDPVELAMMLAENMKRIGFTYEYNETENCQIISDFVPGDLLTVGNFRLGETANDRLLTEIFVTLTKEGDEQIELLFEDYQFPLNDNSGGGGGQSNLPMDQYWAPIIQPVANVSVQGTELAIPKADHQHDMNVTADDAGVMLLTAGVGYITGTNGIVTSIDVNGKLVVDGSGALSAWYIQGNAAVDVDPDVGNSIRLYGSNGYAVTEDVPNNQLEIEGPWYRDVAGAAFIRQKTLGDELRIKEAGAADLFYVDAAGNVGGYTGGGFLQMLFRFYSMGDYAGGSVGIHNINMAGDLTSDMAAGGSHLRWANAGDQGHFHQILTTNAPLGGVTGWVVDEEGHSYWKPAALLTLEGTTYRPPLAPPANVNQVMGVSTAAGTIQMVWKDSPVSLPGTLTAATGNVAGLNHTHAITTTTVSAASTIVATDASGYIRATRLESGNAGNYLTDTGTAFMISADGLGIQLASAGVNQVSVQNGFMFPAVTDDIDLGTAALRWKSVNSLAGDFSTTVTIGAAVLDEVAGDLEVSVDFLPSADNSDTLGTAAKKWSTIYGVEGNLTGDLTVNTAGKGLIMSNNGDKTVMFGNGVRCTMKSTLFTGYTDTFTAGGFRAWLKVYETESTGATVVGYLDGYEHYHNLAGGAATAALGYS